MANLDTIRKLISKIPQIEKRFSKVEIPSHPSSIIDSSRRSSYSIVISVIYKDPVFIKWKDKLVSELSKLKQDTDVEEILDLCDCFNGHRDKKDFNELKAKLDMLAKHLDDYEPDYDSLIQDERIHDEEFSQTMIRILSKLQRNHHYNSECSENTMNDYVRDLLGETKLVKDQSRQGDSESGDDAGEVDIQILDNDHPIVMIECLKLNSLVKNTLSTHINKVLVNYDPNGCPYAFLVIYSINHKFDAFFKRLLKYLEEYEFPYSRQSDISEKETPYSDLKHAQTVLLREGKYIRVHFYVVKVR